jgi:5-formyltetrahydrofolate cyclo-ligase
MRAELIARREAMPLAQRRDAFLSLSLFLMRSLPVEAGTLVGFCWPIRGEYDPRPLLRQWRLRGASCALPCVRHRSEPLVFRPWAPGVPMAPGPMGIPSPVEGGPVHPDLLLVPLVGFGRGGDRLGYGGGYFDRTLAAFEPQPLAIGVGLEIGAIETSYPQDYDIPMDAIVTERGMRWRMGRSLVDVNAKEMRERLLDLREMRAQDARLNAHTVPGTGLV